MESRELAETLIERVENGSISVIDNLTEEQKLAADVAWLCLRKWYNPGYRPSFELVHETARIYQKAVKLIEEQRLPQNS